MSTIDDLKELGSKRLPKMYREYFNRGAMDLITLRENEEAFNRYKIRPASSPTSTTSTLAPRSSAKRSVSLSASAQPPCTVWPTQTANWPHPAVKTGMELRGLRTGGLRKPFKLLGEKETAELKQLLEDADVKVV